MSGKRTMILFYKHGCPYCIDLQPKWLAAKKHFAFEEYEKQQYLQLKDTEHKVGKLTVKTYPTIFLMYNDGRYVQYNGDRSTDDLIKFSKTLQRKCNGMSTLYLFYANWCGFCQRLKPEWELVEQKLHQHPRIKVVKIEESEDPKKMAEFNVQGYPTIVLVTCNGRRPYEGARTAQEILKFAEEHSQG